MQLGFEVDIEEVEYLRHGGKGYLARVFKPHGMGPFPYANRGQCKVVTQPCASLLLQESLGLDAGLFEDGT